MSDELKPCPFCGEMPPVSKKERCAPIVGHACRILDMQITVPLHTWNARAERTCRWVPFDEGYSIAGPGWRCSECGLELGPENAFVVERCYCCPGCCAKVVDVAGVGEAPC